MQASPPFASSSAPSLALAPLCPEEEIATLCCEGEGKPALFLCQSPARGCGPPADNVNQFAQRRRPCGVCIFGVMGAFLADLGAFLAHF